ncbi:MAG: DUF3187 family protein [Spirochaetia bacterium]|jgi:hypothetical protein|nr:DUF3187 family protein [Spirochaetia bacterium]
MGGARTTRIIPRYRGLTPLILALTLVVLCPAWSDDALSGENPATGNYFSKASASMSMADKGPFNGTGFSPHFLIFLNLPGMAARHPTDARYSLGLSTYLSQEFLTSYVDPDDEIPTRHADFENLSLEANGRWYPSPRIQLGATMRLIAYGGGILDWSVEAFHGLFGFPNAGREYYPTNDVFVDYTSTEGYHFFLDRPRISFGDLDLWATATLVDAPLWALAISGGLKVPTGSFEALSGSEGTDLALAALVDLNPHRRFSVYLNAGLTLALTEPNAAPDTGTAFAQAIVAFEYAINHRLSLLLQGNLKSPSMHADIITGNNLGQIGDQLGLPQTNLKFGLRRRSGHYLIQAYMEEDALTNNGVDFTLNLGITRLFR